MAVGLQFYRQQNIIDLKNSLETQNFTLRMNDLFDVLNRKFPAEGIRQNSNDLDVFLCCIVACLWHLC
jgi:hypothetical protein